MGAALELESDAAGVGADADWLAEAESEF